MKSILIYAVSRKHARSLAAGYLADGWSLYSDYCGRIRLFRNTADSFDVMTIFLPEVAI